MKTTGSRASAVSQTRGFGDLLYDKAGARPSLDLDFAGTSSLRDKITGEYLVDHTRASNATYIDNEGLVKKAPKNMLLYSVNPLGSWNRGGATTITEDYGIAPDGTQTAHRIEMAANVGNTYFRKTSVSIETGKTYTFSVWMKKLSQPNILILVSGHVNNITQTLTDTWERYSYTFTASSSTTSMVGFDNGPNQVDALFWHPQFEEGSVATDYIKTTNVENSAPRFTHERVETGNLLHGTNRYLKDWSISSSSSLEPYAALAPDGTYSALKYVNNTGSYNTIYRHENYVSGVKTGKTYTLSAYVKSTGNSSHFKLWTFYGGTYISDTGKTATPTDWTRYEVTFTATADKVRIGFDNSGGNWNTEFLFWGVQLNEGSTADTYVSSIDTFTSRQSNATFVDSAGLVKTSAVNKIHGSHFATGWARDAGLSPSNHRNDVVNPFGETEIQRVLELSHSNTNAQSVWYQTGSGKGTGLLSVYAKANTWSNINFGGQTPSQTVSFNLTNGTINSTAGTTGSIENVGNGWYRCSVNITSNTDWFIFQPHPDGATRAGARMQLVGAGSIFLYGAMFESPVSQPSDFIENLTMSTASFPRYSHDPETLTPTGLYLEPAVTNLANHSNNFSTWTKHSTTTITQANTETLSPDGLYNAWKWTGPANQNYPSIYKTHSTNNLNPHTFSLFAKAGTLDKLGLEIRGTANVPDAFFDLTNGTVQSGTGQIEKYPNGWYRCSVTITTDSSEVLIIRGGDGANQPGTIYIFGAQLEVGRFATSYIPTDTSTVTRAADVYTSTANLTETFVPRGLLTEEARTNVVPYSENFNVSDWNKNHTNLAGQVTSPMGDNTAYNVVPIDNSNYHRINLQFTATTNTYTGSVFVKPNGYRYLHLRLEGGSVNDVGHGFDLQEGIGITGRYNGSLSLSSTSHSIEKYPNGWFKVSVTGNLTSGTGYMGVQISNSATSTAGNATGNSTLGMYVWGAQLETGDFPTSYIPTSGSSVTRAADYATISGDNFGTYRTNLLPKSEHIWDWTVWNPVVGSNQSSIKVVTPYAYPNPIDGKYNAALVHRHSTDYYYIQNINQTYPKTTGYSIYVKPVSNPCIIQLFTQSSQHGEANFDLINKTHGGTGTRNITEVGDGWLKLEWTTPTHTSHPSSVSISLTTDSLTTSRGTGTGTNVKFYVYAPQVENNSITNYIPSTDTFTSRLGNATYVDSNGLVKTAYRNLVVYSNEIGNNLGWIKSNLSATVNNSTAPDGTQTATLLIPNTTDTDSHFIYQTVAYQNGAMSLHVKSAGMSHVSLIHQPANAPTEACGVSVNLNNGTIHATDNATGEIIDEGNGWYRVIVKPTTSVQARYFLIQPNNGEQPNDNNRFRVSYAGNGTDGVYVWGAMQTDNANDAGEYTANLTNVLSGAPRYSHDPETLVPTGLYLEPAAQNHSTRTQLVDDSGNRSGWSNSQNGIWTANAAIAPDGTQTATLLKPTEGTFTSEQQRTGGNKTFVISAFVKSAGYRYVQLFQHGGITSRGVAFDIIDGTIAHNHDPSAHTPSIQKYPNGWFRISMRSTSTNFNGYHGFTLNKHPTDNLHWHGGSNDLDDFDSGFYIWGFNKTEDTLSSPIISNSSSYVTRAADTYTSAATTVLDRDGGNKEAWYNHYGPQTYLLEHQRPQGSWKRVWIVGTDNNAGGLSPIATQVFWRGSAAQPERQFIVDAGTQFQFMPTLSDQTHNYKYGVAMDVNDAQAFDNGALSGTDTSVTLPTGIQTNMPNKVTIGVVGTNPTTFMSSPFARITYWKTRLPDTSLIQISNK